MCLPLLLIIIRNKENRYIDFLKDLICGVLNLWDRAQNALKKWLNRCMGGRGIDQWRGYIVLEGAAPR